MLPAIWSSFPDLDHLHWLRDFFRLEDGERKNPYDLLPPIEIANSKEVVRDGTGAMKAYQEMMYGQYRHDKEKEKSKKARGWARVWQRFKSHLT